MPRFEETFARQRWSAKFIYVLCGSGEMADAQVSGICDSNIMWVRLPSPAPKEKHESKFLI